jgi:tRNA/rRNA methyltransferase
MPHKLTQDVIVLLRTMTAPKTIDSKLNERLATVLCETSHPGNIGSVARAMKVMGFTQLRLVAPKTFPSPEAVTLSSNASDVLDSATVHDSLEAAIATSTLSFAFTARPRDLGTPALTVRDAAQMAREHLTTDNRQVACVFGNETYGLSNAQIMLTTHRVYIPANPNYSSLNLAQAVQIAMYEMQMSLLDFGLPAAERAESIQPASSEELVGLLKHLERAAVASEFLDLAVPKRLMQRMYRLFHRATPEREEIAILRGLLSAFESKMRR